MNRLRKINDVFFRGGVPKEEFDRVRGLVWGRNKRILRITALLSAAMGGVFLFYALFSGSGTWFPYLFLLCGSVAVFVLNRLTEKVENERIAVLLCYGQMALVGVYAGILSTQQSNSAVPATSIVVFIALLPLSVDDRPLRMFIFMSTESMVYLIVSRFLKSPGAFALDVMNVLTFCAVGMVLYGVICTRNVRAICQDIRIGKIQQNIVSSMATVVEERDESTGGHIVRTGDFVRAMIEKMKKEKEYANLPEEYYRNILLAAPMHDIGKIRIPDAILNKPGRLTAEEFEVMKKHAEYGEEIIRETMSGIEEKDFLDIACNIARSHHERFDGRGYPDGKKEEEIPLEARVMALADVYDALISERVYKMPIPKEEAVKIIRENGGGQFDPKLTALFLECVG